MNTVIQYKSQKKLGESLPSKTCPVPQEKVYEIEKEIVCAVSVPVGFKRERDKMLLVTITPDISGLLVQDILVQKDVELITKDDHGCKNKATK